MRRHLLTWRSRQSRPYGWEDATKLQNANSAGRRKLKMKMRTPGKLSCKLSRWTGGLCTRKFYSRKAWKPCQRALSKSVSMECEVHESPSALVNLSVTNAMLVMQNMSQRKPWLQWKITLFFSRWEMGSFLSIHWKIVPRVARNSNWYLAGSQMIATVLQTDAIMNFQCKSSRKQSVEQLKSQHPISESGDIAGRANIAAFV